MGEAPGPLTEGGLRRQPARSRSTISPHPGLTVTVGHSLHCFSPGRATNLSLPSSIHSTSMYRASAVYQMKRVTFTISSLYHNPEREGIVLSIL